MLNGGTLTGTAAASAPAVKVQTHTLKFALSISHRCDYIHVAVAQLYHLTFVLISGRRSWTILVCPYSILIGQLSISRHIPNRNDENTVSRFLSTKIPACE